LQYWTSFLRDHYLQTGAIRRVNASAAKYISRCFLVPKSSGGYRLVVDLRHVNSFFAPPKTKFENLAFLRVADHKVT
jgi:hypothetical protein